MRIISTNQDLNSYTQENHPAQNAVTITTAHGRIFIAVSALKRIVSDYETAMKGRAKQPLREWSGLPSVGATATKNALDVGASEPDPEEPKEKKIEQIEDDDNE